LKSLNWHGIQPTEAIHCTQRQHKDSLLHLQNTTPLYQDVEDAVMKKSKNKRTIKNKSEDKNQTSPKQTISKRKDAPF
jgi:hypothetical protein